MEKAIQGLFLFVALTVTSNVAKADWPVAPNGRVIDPRVANVGYFYCSDCVMTGSYPDPTTRGFITSFVNPWVGGAWVTPNGDVKYVTICNDTICVTWTYQKSGVFTATSRTPNKKDHRYKAAGSFEGGVTINQDGGGGGGGEGGRTARNGGGGSDPVGGTQCWDYYSNGQYMKTECY